MWNDNDANKLLTQKDGNSLGSASTHLAKNYLKWMKKKNNKSFLDHIPCSSTIAKYRKIKYVSIAHNFQTKY